MVNNKTFNIIFDKEKDKFWLRLNIPAINFQSCHMELRLRKSSGVFCPNFEICMGCFVHVILLGVGCFVSLQKHVVVFVHI